MADLKRYDVVVIGSGQAAIPLITALAKSGRKVALIERVYLGGSCINTGCTPTKTMVASARVADVVARAGQYGVRGGAARVDMGEVRQRKHDMVLDFRGGRKSAMERAEGADLLMGEASFTGPKQLLVKLNDGGTEQIEADIIVIDTGSRPLMPDIEGLAEAKALDSTTVMELDEVPEHLLILGGGYIGLEFAQMFRRFGAKVTVIHHGKQLLGREDADVAEAMLDILREDGIEVLLEASPVGVEGESGDKVSVRYTQDGKEHTRSGSHLLVATGRTPNTEALNLAAAGIKTDKRGFITVDSRLATNVEGVYAAGDVNGGPAFTHIAYDDFRILCDNLIYEGKSSTEGRLVPYVVFTDPQLGRVGMSEQEARESGRKIRVAKAPMTWVARAIEVGETRGMMKAIVDAESEEILGCAILGIEGGEMMAMIEIAMMGKLRYPVLRDAVFAHPTLSEALNTLFDSFGED